MLFLHPKFFPVLSHFGVFFCDEYFNSVPGVQNDTLTEDVEFSFSSSDGDSFHGGNEGYVNATIVAGGNSNNPENSECDANNSTTSDFVGEDEQKGAISTNEDNNEDDKVESENNNTTINNKNTDNINENNDNDKNNNNNNKTNTDNENDNNENDNNNDYDSDKNDNSDNNKSNEHNSSNSKNCGKRRTRYKNKYKSMLRKSSDNSSNSESGSEITLQWSKLPEHLKKIAVALYNGVDVRDRKYHLRTYKQCFIGKDAAKFFIEQGFASNVLEAVSLGQQLVFCRVISHVVDQHGFENKGLFYKFNMNPSVLDAPVGCDEAAGSSDSNDLCSSEGSSGNKSKNRSNTVPTRCSKNSTNNTTNPNPNPNKTIGAVPPSFLYNFVNNDESNNNGSSSIQTRASSLGNNPSNNSSGTTTLYSNVNNSEQYSLSSLRTEAISSILKPKLTHFKKSAPQKLKKTSKKYYARSKEEKTFFQVAKRHLQCGKNYTVTPFPGKITLIKSADQPKNKPLQHWVNVVAALSTHTVPGNHVNVIAQQHVVDLAHTIKSTLQEVQETSL
eukprot:CAMPEP_0174267800 /NCGR_PEP_ID=MMETSP0439-20130205/34956_1 /TAXON_ID=0 /ORGANISM="Stereomyxa ramosa, Strain Chinc5" /LENGTH=556 /DNA_ID=CAMNT_0015355515 /DNA_START=65 /DNA_END=1735 /DNA_ORIENTATION=-